MTMETNLKMNFRDQSGNKFTWKCICYSEISTIIFKHFKGNLELQMFANGYFKLFLSTQNGTPLSEFMIWNLIADQVDPWQTIYEQISNKNRLKFSNNLGVGR